MPIKLLKKSEIDKAKSVERQREVQEGMKLAKRVDALREIQSQEEKSLMEFRVKTLSEITKDALKEQEKLDVLKKEVRDLEDRKVEALKPLTEETEKLKKDREFLDKYNAEIVEKTRSLKNEEDKLEERVKEISLKERDVEISIKQSGEIFVKAQSILKDAEEKANSSSEILLASQKQSFEVMKEIGKKEDVLKQQEEVLSAREEDLRRRELELSVGQAVLKDRNELLERNIKRHK